jgi:hypothetical protein
MDPKDEISVGRQINEWLDGLLETTPADAGASMGEVVEDFNEPVDVSAVRLLTVQQLGQLYHDSAMLLIRPHRYTVQTIE